MIQSKSFYTLAAGLAFATAITAATRYSIEDIGPVSSVNAINNRGEVLANDANRLPFLYHRGRLVYLPLAAGGTFYASGLNNSGEVVGYVNPGTYDLAIYRNGELKVVDDVSGVVPVKINDRGQIAGDLVREYRAFLYSDGIVTAYSPAEIGGISATRGMNDKGDVVGVTDAGLPARRGYLYRDGRFSTLSVPGAASSEADAINRQGDIAGMWDTPSETNLFQIFVYRRGRFHNLGHVFGQSVEQDSVAGMNRFGVIVGSGRTLTIPNGGFSAYAYFPQEGFVELNTLIPSDSGWFLQFASGINDRGQIAGTGLLGGISHGYILTPVYGPDDDESSQSETSE